MIRNATKKDIEAIFELISSGSKVGKLLPRAKNEILENINCFFVWEEDKKVAGCCSLEIYSKKLAEIRSLIVLPQFQGKGIASALINRCLKKAKKEKIYEVLSITDRDLLFEKSGFSKCLNNQYPMFIRP